VACGGGCRKDAQVCARRCRRHPEDEFSAVRAWRLGRASLPTQTSAVSYPVLLGARYTEVGPITRLRTTFGEVSRHGEEGVAEDPEADWGCPADRALLATVELPSVAYEIHRDSLRTLHRLKQELQLAPSPFCLRVGADLRKEWADAYVLVRGGILKLLHQGRLLRLYSSGDLIRPSALPGVQIEAMFGCELGAIRRETFEAAVNENPTACRLWSEFCMLENDLNQLLCAAYAPHDLQPHVALRNYASGEVVIHAGDPPGEIFELLQGEAVATAGAVELGRISEGEIFGEMSFLSGEPRCATVTTTAPSLIQVINRKDFELAARARPELMLALGRTLARRLFELNQRWLAKR